MGADTLVRFASNHVEPTRRSCATPECLLGIKCCSKRLVELFRMDPDSGHAEE